MLKNSCDIFLQSLPKAELHVHIEGTLEPQQLLYIAQRNNVPLPIKDVLSADHTSYRFADFHSFIQTYATITQALCKEIDFYEITLAYLEKVHQQGVVHTEIYFDLQTYVQRNVNPDIVVYGIHKGLQEGYKKFGISASMILSLLCNETEQEALENFRLIHEKYKHIINALGIASEGNDNPFIKFKSIFEFAHKNGYHCVAHVGEFDHIELMWSALKNIPIERIDHGIACATDPQLMRELANKKIPLTICPISNVMLGACKNVQEHPIKKIYDAGIIVTINSDDPAFFKSYIADNYVALLHAQVLSCPELVQCARNSINASFITPKRKEMLLSLIDQHVRTHSCT